MVVFTDQEMRELTRLLRRIGEDNGFWSTEEAMRAAHGVISFWAPELVILRDLSCQILLALYDGGVEEFRGKWHIPGGYNRWAEPDIQATCSRVALREIGSDVRFVRVMDAYKWRSDEHPYGHPLSLYCLCEVVGKVQEGEALRFFPLDALPENLIGPHQRFIRESLG